MPRLSLSLSTTIFSIALASGVSAYATDPEPVRFSQVALPSASVAQIAGPTDICAKDLTPALAALIGVEPSWAKDVDGQDVPDVACLAE